MEDWTQESPVCSTSLWHLYGNSTSELVEVLDQSLEAVIDWRWMDELTLNPDKTEVLLVS